MTASNDTDTDLEWEQWGLRDPYFGVITDPRFRRATLNAEARHAFFQSGVAHANHVIETVRQRVVPHFAPKRLLDFGCGVGRLVIPFAALAQEVVGLDVSPSMLEEARKNCADRQLRNVSLHLSDDDLSTAIGEFDLIHSSIVFQHIPVDRGRRIIAKLLTHLAPGGVGALQLTYSKTCYATTGGVPPPELSPPPVAVQRPRFPAPTPTGSRGDPEIQMNPYHLNQVMFLLQCAGVERLHLEFTNHGGELGVFLFFAITGPPVRL